MIRAVVDTNVLVSALLSPSGNEAMVISAIENGSVIPVLSTAIITEYREVLSRQKFARVWLKVPALLALMTERGLMLEPGRCSFVSPDPGDQAFLDCAIAGDVDFIVTGNRRDFPGPYDGNTEVVNSRQLLARLSPAP